MVAMKAAEKKGMIFTFFGEVIKCSDMYFALSIAQDVAKYYQI